MVAASAISCGPTTTVDLSAAADGAYTLSVTATDPSGNPSPSAGTASYTLDSTVPAVPTVTLSSPASSPGNSASPQFSVTDPDSSPGGLTYSCTVTGPSVVPASAINCGPTTTVDLSATGDGGYTLTVTATDQAGNTSPTPGTASYTLDTGAPPAPSITLPAASTKLPVFGISDGDPTVTFTCLFLSPTGRTVFPISGSSTCPANGGFDTTAFPEGAYTLTVTATDPAGNSTTTTVTWTRDTIPPPPPTVVAPASPSNNRNPTFLIGDTEAGAMLTCVLTGPDATGLTAFSGPCPANGRIAIPGADGVYTLTVTAEDAASNVNPTTASASYTLDATAPNQPTVVRTFPAQSPSSATQAKFTVTDLDSSPGGALTYHCSVSGPTAVPAASINCGPVTTVDLSGAGRDGAYTLSVTATDAAQNTSPTAGTATYVLDTTAPPAPQVALTAPSVSPGNDTTPVFGVSDADVSAGLTYSCSVTGVTSVPASSITCGSSVMVNLAGAGRDGDYQLSVTATDAAGNTSLSAGTASYTLDTTAPSPPIVGLASATRSSSKTPVWTWQYGLNDLDTGLYQVSCTLAGPQGWTTTRPGCSHQLHPTLGGGNGAYTMTVTLTDEAGNSSSAVSPTYTLDSTAPAGPTALLIHPLRGVGLDRHPQWTVHGPTNSTLLCTLLRGGHDGVVIVPEAVCPKPATYSLAGRSDGMYTLKVVAVDSSGNRSFPAWSSYVLAPEAPEVHAPAGPGPHTVWTVEGSAQDSFVCTLIHSGVPVSGPRSCGSHPTYDMSQRGSGRYTLSVVQVGPEGARSAPGTATWLWVGPAPPHRPHGGNRPVGTGSVPPVVPPAHHKHSHPIPRPNPASLGPLPAVRHVTHNSAGHSAVPFVPPVHLDHLTRDVTSAVQGVVHAVGSAGGGTGFPLLLLGLVIAFLVVQSRIDGRDPKLALASIAADDLVVFQLPPSRRDRP